ncbi:Origin recognition complex subunit 3 [Gnomoniopsis smithogilvyi]|uniref:Origin recognition complex subunit 3 n=1 Tax=Gnomoniopsis smithogilvyi TaxID=1191159 RepID=A0A9W8YY39_9PEZI|nr:Origin recognition complex subunit 3 [Gnomoniopsis smithogilvyi]
MEQDEDGFLPDDHRVAFVFGQDDETATRPTKRRRVSKNTAAAEARQAQTHGHITTEFVPLFNGAEKPELVELRQKQFAASWAAIDARIQNVLKDSNRTTLNAVSSFVRDAIVETPQGKIPAALIVTGPNIALQDLLFTQLGDAVQEGWFVRLRSAEAPNLKATLRKIIRDVTRAGFARDADGEDELAVGNDGRKYLDYDLEALYAHVKPYESKQVTIAFQDSEAFDTSLLSDLIRLFSSWKDRISFTLLFGIATSVELFQARLLKSTSQCLYGAQFDVVQMSSILESVFKCAVAHQSCPLKLGPVFLGSLVERQQSQVAGIQLFISSLKYAYMCHFYANALSVLLIQPNPPQPEHNEALRNLPSFRHHVESAVEEGKLQHTRSLLLDDAYLASERLAALKTTQKWEDSLLRSLALLVASEVPQEDFITLYISALANGIDLHNEDSPFLEAVKRMSVDDISSLLQRLSNVIKAGDPELGLLGWADEDGQTSRTLAEMIEQIASLQSQAQLNGFQLRSQYTAQSRVLRTTVIAQKVQLSQDESNLTKEDKLLTDLVDNLLELLAATISCQPADAMFLHELWMYESKAPHKDVFIPRPGTIFERALSRPYDYLACACCSTVFDGGNAATLPTTSLLYHLYQETGALMNVADMWSAFYAMVGKSASDDELTAKAPRLSDDSGYDERIALVLFYQGLADLKAMGFVKATRRRPDHIAKNKWLL